MKRYFLGALLCLFAVAVSQFAAAQVVIPEIFDYEAYMTAAFEYLGSVIGYTMTFLFAVTVAWRAYSYFRRA